MSEGFENKDSRVGLYNHLRETLVTKSDSGMVGLHGLE